MHINVVFGPYCAKPLSPSIMMIYDQHRFQNLNDLVKILKKILVVYYIIIIIIIIHYCTKYNYVDPHQKIMFSIIIVECFKFFLSVVFFY